VSLPGDDLLAEYEAGARARRLRVVETPVPDDDDGFDLVHGVDGAAPESGPAIDLAPVVSLPSFGTMLRPALECAKRRADGVEKPIATPWRTIDEHFAGGFWNGVHFINAGTGTGKTQFALQVTLGAAARGVPVGYIGLELGPDEIAMRGLGLTAHVPWSALFTGKAGPAYLERAAGAIPKLEALPIHPFFGDPLGFPVGRLLEIAKAMRAQYPEMDGPGSRPLALVLDFLQLVGDDPGSRRELRERIAHAAYQCRSIARDLGFAVLVISSIARDKYDLEAIAQRAGLAYDEDPDGYPIKRRIRAPDVLIGVGKESGEIEFSADSLSVLWRVSSTRGESGVDVVFATVKGRATSTTWSALHFTGFRFDEPGDRGAAVVQAWRDAGEARAQERAQKQEAKETAKDRERDAKTIAKAVRLARYVLANPGCTTRAARVNAAGDNSATWNTAVAKLGPALVKNADGLTLDRGRMPADVAGEIGGAS
jgi:hypothetical protein